MMRLKIIFIFVVLLNIKTIKTFAQFYVGGSYENNSTLIAGTEPTDFINGSQFKLELNYKNSDVWRLYSDIRLSFYYGIGDTLSSYPDSFLYKKDLNGKGEFAIGLEIPRMYFKANASIATFTIGRNYITFGHASIFNTLEWYKNFSLLDPLATKPAINLISMDLGIGSYGKYKIFVGGDDYWESALVGSEIIFGTSGFEMGIAYQYKGDKKNVLGTFFKADIYVSIFGSYAAHINDVFDNGDFNKDGFNNSHEASIGLDYSFPISYMSLLVSQSFYYNSLGAKNYSELMNTTMGDYYFRSQFYSYTSLLLTVDEFTTVGADVLVNMIDGSGVVLPRFLLTLANDLTLDVAMGVYFGDEDTEFSYLEEGIPNFSMLVKLVASF